MAADMRHKEADMVTEDDERDSLEERFGGEYSEDTLNQIREYEKPPWQEPESTLDPETDLDEYIQFDFRLPPKSYDHVQEELNEDIQLYKDLQQLDLPAEEQQKVRYRQQLVDAASADDIRWLKLKAYQRGVNKLRAEKEAKAPEGRRQLLKEYEVPLDVVPQELIDATPEQLAQRHRKARETATKRQLQQLATPTGLNADQSYSEESEWLPEWDSTSYANDPYVRLNMVGALLAFARKLYGAPKEQAEALQEPDASSHAAEASRSTQEITLIHGYTPEYQELMRLERKATWQARQRAAAFWLSLGSVIGLTTFKWLRRAWKSRKQGPSPPVSRRETETASVLSAGSKASSLVAGALRQ